MKKQHLLLNRLMAFLFLLIVNNSVVANDTIKSNKSTVSNEVVFDKDKWLQHKGDYYPYRDEILDSILHTQLVRSLNKREIIKLLGEPSYYREDRDFLYYLIKKKTFLDIWTLHTKTLVIKLKDDKTVQWIKIHE